MDNKLLLYEILYIGFLDIRSAAREKKSYTAIFKVADLLHNLPSQLHHAQENAESYQKILINLQARARELECDSWLNNAIRNANQWADSSIRHEQSKELGS